MKLLAVVLVTFFFTGCSPSFKKIAVDDVQLPDSEFHRIHSAINGKSEDNAIAYASLLSDYRAEPDFKCYQPVYARYFQRRLGLPSLENSCNEKVPFSLIDRYDSTAPLWLDPKRVSSIHFLFAGKSQSMASRFGHVALRLVVCPEENRSASACDANLFEHIVLGFQAHIDELSLDTMKALTGEYKAYLFANRFMDVYEEYAIGEFREIYSLPLQLQDAQRETMVRELSDIHWRYSGPYRFFTHNCATMLQDALRVLLPELAASDAMRSDYLRPDRLFEAIRATHFVDAGKIVSLDSAEREGYFFSNTQPFYAQALSDVKSAMKDPRFADLESYLKIDPLERRRARQEDARFMMLLVQDNHLYEAQMMLEEYAVIQGERQLMIQGAKYFEVIDLLEKASPFVATLSEEHAKIFEVCMLEPLRQHSRPIRKADGIPKASDIPTASDPFIACQMTQNRKLLQEVITQMKDEKSEEWKRLNAISRYLSESITNVNLLKKI